ncbi:hypothetical protein [Tengunoibacter tsumagoiensis]|uniref:Uncharacterized protein n=1 Tax=Tengunoibacter tsumagoiensis TaxID=2014871 RepID=A0A401ZW64_9CHLR|nr:hypothetical protein [Tengunoibacter tsumagoiensis]GCE11151.1 hypothetical protein KTT_10100 [Tengunoibacter tsumagoiensis]
MPQYGMKSTLAIADTLRVAAILLFIMVIAFECIPVFSSHNTDDLILADRQRTRAELFARDALILVYRPQSEWSGAISDLQSILPLFENEEVILEGNSDSQMMLQVQQMRGDYLALDAAIKAILKQPIPSVFQLQLGIILVHDRPFIIAMNSVVSIIQRQENDRDRQLFYIEVGVELLIITLILTFIFFSRTMMRKSWEAGIAEERMRRDKELQDKS